MKKINLILIGILFAGLVTAGAFVFDITSVTYPSPQNVSPPSGDTITWDCGGVPQSAEKYETKWDENDLQSLTRQNCSETITNIMKGSEKWQVNSLGETSFNETYLKSRECEVDGKELEKGDCVTPSLEIEVAPEL